MRYILINTSCNPNKKRKFRGFGDLKKFVEKIQINKNVDEKVFEYSYKLFALKEIAIDGTLYREDHPEKRRKEDYKLNARELLDLINSNDCPIFPRKNLNGKVGRPKRKKSEITPNNEITPNKM